MPVGFMNLVALNLAAIPSKDKITEVESLAGGARGAREGLVSNSDLLIKLR